MNDVTYLNEICEYVQDMDFKIWKEIQTLEFSLTKYIKNGIQLC